MKQRGRGTIVNIGWDQAETGMAGDSGELFSATKGAVAAFTRSLAQSLAPAVRVNCVAPGLDPNRMGPTSQRLLATARVERIAARAVGDAGRRGTRGPVSGFAGRQFHHRPGDRRQRRAEVSRHGRERHLCAENPLRHRAAGGACARRNAGQTRAAGRFRVHDRRARNHRGGADDARVDRPAHSRAAGHDPRAAARLLRGRFGADWPRPPACRSSAARAICGRLPEFFGQPPPAGRLRPARHPNRGRDQSLPAADARRNSGRSRTHWRPTAPT